MIVGLIASILMPERELRQRAGLSDALEEAATVDDAVRSPSPQK